MKNKKFNLKWQSLVLGVALCLVLAVFLTGKAQSNPVDGSQKVLQRPANLNDVWEKTAALEANIIALNERLIRIEKKIDAIADEVNRALQNTRKILKEETKK